LHLSFHPACGRREVIILLVVDDDEDVLDALIDVLEGAGFAIMFATSGEEAIMKASGAAPDVLVTDLDLGAGMNGIQLAAEVRRRWPGLPIVYISGHHRMMNARSLDDREVFLPKPFHERELLGGLHAVSTKVN
jgi:CheY-like chemotaxis protein